MRGSREYDRNPEDLRLDTVSLVEPSSSNRPWEGGGGAFEPLHGAKTTETLLKLFIRGLLRCVRRLTALVSESISDASLELNFPPTAREIYS